MKKLVWLLLGFLVAGTVFIATVNAGPLDKATKNLNLVNQKLDFSNDLTGTVATIIKVILSLVGTIFLILTIYAGILWMTAQGEEDKIAKSKGIIQAAIIGLIIVLSAYTITVFVSGKLGAATTPTPGVPEGGCCVAKDKKVCAENVPVADCNLDTADWSQGACPAIPGVTCVKN